MGEANLFDWSDQTGVEVWTGSWHGKEGILAREQMAQKGPSCGKASGPSSSPDLARGPFGARAIAITGLAVVLSAG